MFKHVIRYLINGVFIKGIGLVSLPIYTFFLSPSEYGVYAILLSYIALGGVLLSLNTHASISRFYYEENIDINAFLSSTVWLTVFIFFSFFLIFLALDEKWLTEVLGVDFVKYGPLVFFVIFCNIFFSIYTQTLIPDKKSGSYTIITSTKAVLTVLISTVLLFLHNEVLSLLYGVLVSESLFFLYIVYRFFGKVKFKIKWSNVKYILSYSVFLLPYSLSGIVLAQIDRVMLAKYYSVESTGIYSVAYTLSMMPWMIFVLFSKGWTPEYFSYMNKREYYSLNRDVRYILLASTYLVVFLMLFLSDIASLIFNEQYSGIEEILPILLYSTLYIILWQMWGRGIGYSKKTIYTSAIGLLAAFINVLLNYIFIPKYGELGAGYATLFSYSIMAFSGYLVSKYLLNVYTVSIFNLKIFFLFLVFSFLIVLIPFYVFYYKVFFAVLSFWLLFVYRKFFCRFVRGDL